MMLESIGTAIGSVKMATDIARGLITASGSVEKAELKLKIAEIANALAEARLALVDVQETVAAKDARIAELEEAFSAKNSLVRQNDAYYRVDEEGKPTGIPYCLRCWDVDHQQRQLVISAVDNRSRVCTVCKTHYERRMTPGLQTSAE
jgi:hypothetical protein